MQIIIDDEIKAELPTDNTKHSRFMAVIEMFIHGDWNTFTLKRERD